MCCILYVFFVYSLPVSGAALRTPTGVASLISVQKKVKRLKVQAAGGVWIVQHVLHTAAHGRVVRPFLSFPLETSILI